MFPVQRGGDRGRGRGGQRGGGYSRGGASQGSNPNTVPESPEEYLSMIRRMGTGRGRGGDRGGRGRGRGDGAPTSATRTPNTAPKTPAATAPPAVSLPSLPGLGAQPVSLPTLPGLGGQPTAAVVAPAAQPATIVAPVAPAVEESAGKNTTEAVQAKKPARSLAAMLGLAPKPKPQEGGTTSPRGPSPAPATRAAPSLAPLHIPSAEFVEFTLQALSHSRGVVALARRVTGDRRLAPPSAVEAKHHHPLLPTGVVRSAQLPMWYRYVARCEFPHGAFSAMPTDSFAVPEDSSVPAVLKAGSHKTFGSVVVKAEVLQETAARLGRGPNAVVAQPSVADVAHTEVCGAASLLWAATTYALRTRTHTPGHQSAVFAGHRPRTYAEAMEDEEDEDDVSSGEEADPDAARDWDRDVPRCFLTFVSDTTAHLTSVSRSPHPSGAFTTSTTNTNDAANPAAGKVSVEGSDAEEQTSAVRPRYDRRLDAEGSVDAMLRFVSYLRWGGGGAWLWAGWAGLDLPSDPDLEQRQASLLQAACAHLTTLLRLRPDLAAAVDGAGPPMPDDGLGLAVPDPTAPPLLVVTADGAVVPLAAGSDEKSNSAVGDDGTVRLAAEQHSDGSVSFFCVVSLDGLTAADVRALQTVVVVTGKFLRQADPAILPL